MDSFRPVIWDTDAQVSVSSTAVSLGDESDNHDYAIITVENAAIRYRFTGTAPTSSNGHVGNIGDIIELFGSFEVANFKAIRKDGADALLHVTFGGNKT